MTQIWGNSNGSQFSSKHPYMYTTLTHNSQVEIVQGGRVEEQLVHIPPNTRGVKLVLIELQLICHLCNLYGRIKAQWTFCCQ